VHREAFFFSFRHSMVQPSIAIPHPMKHIKVVCAVIMHQDKILCMQRAHRGSPSTAGKWEFPGGKIEAGERPEEALLRELREEMDYTVRVVRHLIDVDHQYPDFTITLQAYLCQAASIDFNRKEHIDHCWLNPCQLRQLDWAAADDEILKAIEDEFTLI